MPGLFERSLAGGRPPRLCRDYIREQACEIFYDPKHVSDELVDDVYAMLSDRHYRRFLLKVAKATRDRYMLDELANGESPDDDHLGARRLDHAAVCRRAVLRQHPDGRIGLHRPCGHAPPIEQPDEFARVLDAFLDDMKS